MLAADPTQQPPTRITEEELAVIERRSLGYPIKDRAEILALCREVRSLLARRAEEENRFGANGKRPPGKTLAAPMRPAARTHEIGRIMKDRHRVSELVA